MTQAMAPELRNLAGRQLGRYEVLTQLASGGMAAVYVARAKGVAGFERLVAVKVLHPHLAYEDEFISMFLDEARLAARIRHPNVVGTLDISDTQGDGFFLVMEYIEGDHLGALLAAAARAGERVPTPIVARIVLDALHGLSAAHELTDETGERLELVHRDISPHNVMVGVDGIGRLTDFGVAKAEKRLTSTRAGHFKGKLAYMAPEQASTGHADQRSDLFAMGILLWESLTGRRLFRADNNAATLTKILQEPIPSVSELVPELAPFDALLERALTREPEERFQSAEEFADALEKLAREHGGVASVRAVGAEVRKWLSEKLDAQRERIREAMRQLGHADHTEPALPVPRDGSLSSISRSGPRPVPADAATSTGSIAERRALGVPLAPVAPEPTSSNRRWIVGVAAAVVVLGFGGAAALLLSRGAQTQPEAASAPPTVAAPAGGSSQAERPLEAAPAVPSEVDVPSEVTRDEAAPDVATPREADGENSADPAAEQARSARSERRRDREAARNEALSMDEAVTSTMDAVEPAMVETSMVETSMVEASVMQDPPRMDPPRMVAPQDEPIFNPYRQ
jgi:serine/threonine protein kinase